MHSFLRAIGFSNIHTREELNDLVKLILEKSSEKTNVSVSNHVILQEISMKFTDNMGISLRGELSQQGEFHLEHYYPYYIGNRISTTEEVLINKKVDTESYTGMCDDNRIGVSLIFYLQNIMEYLNHKMASKHPAGTLPITLSALSVEGKILLGIDNNEKALKNAFYETKRRNQLISEAKRGNQDAIDSLTIDDIDLYAMITRRSRHEDVYSIVESTFIPYGSESDNYTVIGEIADTKLITNEFTNEEIYELLIDCNDIMFNLCINKSDLLGEPAVGRRFKGNIWMQGHVNFTEC